MANKPMKICNYCRRVDSKGRKKCPDCGSKMEVPDAETMAEIKKMQKKNNKI